MNPNTSEAPDRYCKTTGDGACVSKDTRCMHWPKAWATPAPPAVPSAPRARRAIDALLFWVWRRFQPKPSAPAEWYDYVGQQQPIDVLLRDAAAALRILGDSPLLRDIEATRHALLGGKPCQFVDDSEDGDGPCHRLAVRGEKLCWQHNGRFSDQPRRR